MSGINFILDTKAQKNFAKSVHNETLTIFQKLYIEKPH